MESSHQLLSYLYFKFRRLFKVLFKDLSGGVFMSMPIETSNFLPKMGWEGRGGEESLLR